LALCIALAALALCAAGSRLTANSTRDRTISLYNIHTGETLTVQYMKGGRHIPSALAKINWILRDWRKNDHTEMDPDLIDLLWEIHNELGSAEPIHVISGYRSRGTNEMLRKTVGGQASQSRHILGKAADVQFPDVPVKKLRYSALIRERGGVGYYPTSAIPFVHVDTGRVRSWPRLPRAELALLFPSGHTQHLPADGEPITKADVRKARATNTELATQIALFHRSRGQPRPPTQLASLTPSLPQLLGPPREVTRPPAFGTRPTDSERARLAALAAEPPRLLQGPTPASRGRRGQAVASAPLSRGPVFVQAPAYDDEHPEELSYRPFPITPFLTVTSSFDDPALARMLHPDVSRTLELLDQTNLAPPLRLRPGVQFAQLIWAQEFKGEAIDLSSFLDADASSGPSRLANRRVQTRSP
jgi:uncharacterized protein YcbK (DUF882 family)